MPNNKWVAELKTVLQVSKARLDVREKKKTEQVAKERYSVADYVRNNKIPRARIAVEHLVREDYKIEAMDRIEAYVDTLLMRMQLIKDRPKNATVDPAVEQPLANILWAAPFLTQDIPELGQVTAMFKRHFGPEYVSLCEQNKLGMVDVDLLRCLSCDLIPKLLIEKYLVEICRSQSVAFEPDPTIMAQDEFWAIGQRYVQPTPPVTTTIDEKRPPPPPASSSKQWWWRWRWSHCKIRITSCTSCSTQCTDGSSTISKHKFWSINSATNRSFRWWCQCFWSSYWFQF